MRNLLKFVNALIKNLFISFSLSRLFISILIGWSAANLLWLYFLQWPFITLSRVLALVFAIIAFTSIAYILLILTQKQFAAKNIHWKLLAIFCAAFSGLLFFSLGIEPVSNVLFTRESMFSITSTGTANPLSQGKKIVVNYMETELTTITSGTEVSFNQFSFRSDWVQEKTYLVNNLGVDTSTHWLGRAGKDLTVSFSTGPDFGQVILTLNGSQQTVDLYAPENGYLTILFQIPKTIPDRLTGFISIGTAISLCVFFLAAFLLTSDLSHKKNLKWRKPGWLVYAVPILLSWTVYLLAFWPGLLSQDSINQWGQVVNFAFRSAHPPFHTILIWLSSRLWNTPTTFIGIQIFIQAVVIAWGLKIFREMGIPKWVNWVITAIFSFSPVVGMMMVTLWKDIPYSTTLFVLSIMMAQVVFSRGEWLKKPSSWVWLGLVSAMASLFRHNGLGVIILLFPTLILLYKERARFTLYALGIFLAFFSLVSYVLFPLLHVEMETGFSNITFLHQIAAHLHHETPVKPSEEEFLNSLLPIEEWREKYDPCTVNTIMFHEDFNIEKFFFDEINQPVKIFLGQFFQKPMVSIQHILTSGSMVWKIKPVCGMYYSPFDKYEYEKEPFWQIKWVLANDYGLAERSKFPLAADIFGKMFFQAKELLLFSRPAVSWFFILFAATIISLRFSSFQYFLIGAPAIYQSLLLFAVNISQDFRYQLSVYMIGIYFIGLLFIPKRDNCTQCSSHEGES